MFRQILSKMSFVLIYKDFRQLFEAILKKLPSEKAEMKELSKIFPPKFSI